MRLLQAVIFLFCCCYFMQRGQAVEIYPPFSTAYFYYTVEYPKPNQPSKVPKEETFLSEIEETESEITSCAFCPFLLASSAFNGCRVVCAAVYNASIFLSSKLYYGSNSGLYLLYCCFLL